MVVPSKKPRQKDTLVSKSHHPAMKKLKLESAEGHSSALVTKTDDNESHSFKKKKKKKSKFKIQDSEISSTAPDIKEEMPVSPDDVKEENADNVKEVKIVDSDIRKQLSALWLNYKPRSTTLVKTGADWYTQLFKEKSTEEITIDPLTKKELKQIATKILQQDVENYKKVEEKNSKKGDMKFRKNMYSNGTFRDKLAAHVLRCMESPVHSLHHLNSIVAMITPKAKNEFEEVLKSLIQLLDSTLLPNNRVARKFENHQFACLLPMLANNNREQAEKQLALWHYEDQLNFTYKRLITQLKQVASDTVDKTKIVGIRSMVNLVKTHPRQDAEIVLEAVINKLGDPSRKVAAQTMHCLQRLLQQWTQFKESVVNTVEMLLFRPNVATKTQYFCLCYLKDILFKRTDSQLAGKLIKLYIGFFKACTKKGEVDTRMMGALLRGINRAFPYSRLQGDALQEQLETLYKLCHVVNFSIATQALQLIYQVVTSKNQVEDRFYQALYRQIQDPTFGASSGNAAFLNLVFKAMMRDESVERRQAFIKRLLQVAQHQNPHLMCGILFLVSEIMKEKVDMKSAVQKVLKTHIEEVDPDDDFETFEDVEDDNESGLEGDTSMKGEEEEDTKDEFNDSKEGLIEDLKPPDMSVAAPGISSWFHQSNTIKNKTLRRDYYDPYIRDPQYCGAQYSPLWELLFLQAHYHPSVAVFTNKIVSGEVIDYSGDPMQDFTLMRFLDRFVYKNPKKDIEHKENPTASVLGSKASYCPDGARGVAVNTDEFKSLEGTNIPEDQQFFHNYFSNYKPTQLKVKDDDEGSVDDEEFDDYMKKLSGAGGDDITDIDENLDFAAGATGTAQGGDENEDTDEDEDGEVSDEEPEFEGDSDESGDDQGAGKGDHVGFDDDDLDFDEEDVDFSDDDDEFDSASAKKGGKSKKPLPKKRSKGGSLGSMFASADDFTHLLEDNADEDTGVPSTTSKAFANKDKANPKQLNWEMDRNDKITERGHYGNWKNKRGQNKPSRGSGNKSFRGSGNKPSRGRGSGNKSSRGSGGQRNFKGSSGGQNTNFKSSRGRGSFRAKRGGKRK